MYYVEYEDDMEDTLHVGDGQHRRDCLRMSKLKDRIHRVKMIQADGHELEAIQKKFTGPLGICTVPMPDNQVCQWWGDMAKTIHANLLSPLGFGM